MDKNFWKECLKRWPLLGSFVAGLAACHFYYKELRLDQITAKHDLEKQLLESKQKTSELKQHGLEEKLQKQEDYEQKYITEFSRYQTLDRKYNELVIDKEAWAQRYSDLAMMKWEEKYNTEKLAKVSALEETALLKQRLLSAEAVVPQADPELIKQLTLLRSQISILTNERDELRKLYISASSNDVANSKEKIIRLLDYDKKRVLLTARRAETIERLNTLRVQLINISGAYMRMASLGTQRQGNMSNAQINEWIEKYLGDVVGSLVLIQRLHSNWIIGIYDEDDTTMTQGLGSSFEDFQALVGKKSPTLLGAESIVTSITEIGTGTEEGDFLQRVKGIIESQVQNNDNPKSR